MASGGEEGVPRRHQVLVNTTIIISTIIRGMLANEVFRRAHPKVILFSVLRVCVIIKKQRLTIGEFLRLELVEKRGLKIFSGVSRQEAEDLPFQPVRVQSRYCDHPPCGRFGWVGTLL